MTFLKTHAILICLNNYVSIKRHLFECNRHDDFSYYLKLFKNSDNVFILRTFSKIYGLSALRIGWGYGAKKIVDELYKIKPPFNINKIAQLAAVEALKDQNFIQRSIKHNLFYAKKIKLFLEKYQIYSNTVTANFLFLDFSKAKIKAKEFYNKLKNKGIILRSTDEGYNIENKLLKLACSMVKNNINYVKNYKSIHPMYI